MNTPYLKNATHVLCVSVRNPLLEMHRTHFACFRYGSFNSLNGFIHGKSRSFNIVPPTIRTATFKKHFGIFNKKQNQLHCVLIISSKCSTNIAWTICRRDRCRGLQPSHPHSKSIFSSPPFRTSLIKFGGLCRAYFPICSTYKNELNAII